MSMTLSDMRTTLLNKINQSGSSNTIWSNDDLDDAIRSGIRFVIDRGRLELIRDSVVLSSSLTSAGSGLYNKPANYFRFVSAKIGNNYTNRLYDIEAYNHIEGNDLLNGDSDNNNIYDYDNTYFLVTPTTSVLTVIVRYVKELVKTDFNADTDISPLTDTGNDYAIDYAYSLLLLSKLYQPEIGNALMNNVIKRIM